MILRVKKDIPVIFNHFLLIATFFIWLSLLFPPKNLYSTNQNDYKIDFKRINLHDDYLQGKIYCIEQDKLGFIWLGTENGLIRYDGSESVVFFIGNSDRNLPDEDILALHTGKDSSLWIGTNGAGLFKFDPETRTFTSYNTGQDADKFISDNYIWDIEEDEAGNIWIATNEGLNCIPVNHQNTIQIRSDNLKKGSLSSNYVWDLLIDSQGYLWIATYQGINIYDTKHKRFLNVADIFSGQSLSYLDVRKIYQDSNGDFWIATNNGLFKISTKRKSINEVSLQDDNDAIVSNDIRSVMQDVKGNIWVGTTNGLIRLSKGKLFPEVFLSHPDVFSTISNNTILTLYSDASGILWIGTQNGLSKFDPGQNKFGLFDLKSVRAVCEDDNNNIWAGTENGLFFYDNNEKKPTTFVNDPADNQSLSNDYVTAIMQDSKQRIWVGTYGGGLNLFDFQGKKFHQIKYNPLDSNSLSSDKVWDIFEDRNGNIWVGTYLGLNLLADEENYSFIRFENKKGINSLSDNYVICIEENQKGELLIGTDKGLNIFNPVSRKFHRLKKDTSQIGTLAASTIWCILPAENNTYWIGTHEGLYFYNKGRNTCDVIRKSDGLPSNIIYAILSDNLGYLWLSTSNGICRFNPKLYFAQKEKDVSFYEKLNNNPFMIYGAEDGLQGKDFFAGSFHKGESGLFYFGGSNGLNYFHPQKVQNNKYKPQIAITDFRVFNKSAIIDPEKAEKKNYITKTGDQFYISGDLNYSGVITVTHHFNVFSFNFSALHYSIPSQNRYAYKMEGFDEDWIDAGKINYANYTNLDPGTYIFRVIASNADGLWNKEGISVKIIIKPPFWRTTGFTVFMVVFLIAILITFIKLREKRIQHQKNELETQVKERTREIIAQKEEIEQQRDEITSQRDNLEILNTELAQQKEEIITQRDNLEQLNSELEQQKEEITAQRDEISIQKNQLTLKNKHITDSIRYAEKIQQAILPPFEFIEVVLPESFIFYRPKDIVSGDFYWIELIEKYLFVAAVDCTGHGVPGAFMSIVGNNLLNQAVREQGLRKPNEILDYVSISLNIQLRQKADKYSSVKDGMDIALCVFDMEQKLRYVEYAGAFNPLYIVRNKELIQYKANSRSIGAIEGQKKKHFTNNKIWLQEDDVIYLFSDGLIDQFGGKYRKKFLKKRMRELLLQIAHLPMNEQKSILIETHEKWKGSIEQIDDILIMGIRITDYQ